MRSDMITQLATCDMFPGGEISRQDILTFGMGGKLGYDMSVSKTEHGWHAWYRFRFEIIQKIINII